MVTHWGMSDRLGPISCRIGEEHVFLGKELQEPRDFSEATMSIIDEEVQKLLREADQRAFDILKERRGDLDRLVESLLLKEELYEEEIAEILGQHPRSQLPHANGPPNIPPCDVAVPVSEAHPNGS